VKDSYKARSSQPASTMQEKVHSNRLLILFFSFLSFSAALSFSHAMLFLSSFGIFPKGVGSKIFLFLKKVKKKRKQR
jgi:hypothetical protein